MVAKNFQIHGVKITGKCICESKNWLFTHALKQNSPPGFYHHNSRQKEIAHFLQTKIFENLFFPGREEEGYGAENMTKIKLAKVLVTRFDKFHSTICNLYFFGFCFVVP